MSYVYDFRIIYQSTTHDESLLLCLSLLCPFAQNVICPYFVLLMYYEAQISCHRYVANIMYERPKLSGVMRAYLWYLVKVI